MKELLGDDVYQALLDDIELLDVAGDPFDFDKVRAGELTPMFFGSAMTNFGVKTILREILRTCSIPCSTPSCGRNGYNLQAKTSPPWYLKSKRIWTLTTMTVSYLCVSVLVNSKRACPYCIANLIKRFAYLNLNSSWLQNVPS